MSGLKRLPFFAHPNPISFPTEYSLQTYNLNFHYLDKHGNILRSTAIKHPNFGGLALSAANYTICKKVKLHLGKVSE